MSPRQNCSGCCTRCDTHYTSQSAFDAHLTLVPSANGRVASHINPQTIDALAGQPGFCSITPNRSQPVTVYSLAEKRPHFWES